MCLWLSSVLVSKATKRGSLRSGGETCFRIIIYVHPQNAWIIGWININMFHVTVFTATVFSIILKTILSSLISILLYFLKIGNLYFWWRGSWVNQITWHFMSQSFQCWRCTLIWSQYPIHWIIGIAGKLRFSYYKKEVSWG